MYKKWLQTIQSLVRMKLTLRYICPCPAAVPLSSTDWLIVDVAEAPIGRLLVLDPDPDVTLAWKITTSYYDVIFFKQYWKSWVIWGENGVMVSREKCFIVSPKNIKTNSTYSCGAGGLRRAAAGRTWLTTGSQSSLRGREEVQFPVKSKLNPKRDSWINH